MTPREKEPEVGEFASAVAKTIANLMTNASISGRELARRIDRSNNYVAIRLREEAAFTLTDIESIGEALGFEPSTFLTTVSLSMNRQPNIKPFPLKSVFDPEALPHAAYPNSEEPDLIDP